ncbi:carbohydrate ABC transporter permease [Paenibacillus sp.]|uniref:carbohydrate ABC transporter permease n=1 Tax=Paenibacillus sp. TaxID=58172 RepID=UPI002D613B52|nr:carbohydrate ABC transporter permease [Paenibacillus sp.]HZG88112.1 carbohydrate ABC transporter permease [Paenibacillus sp.]
MPLNQQTVSRYVTILLIAFVGILMMYPLLWMISSSFKPEEIIFKDKSLWPAVFTLENYVNGWRGYGGLSFSTFYANSFLVVLFVILGNLITCSMAAYAFARLKFALRKLYFAVMLVTIMLPYHVVLIPQYTLFFKLGWVDTFLPLIVPKFLATDAFFIFLMVQFIRGIPHELDQAATVDGCSVYQIYWRIVLPLAVPALVTTTIFTFIWTWNDFLSQLIYISNPKLFTISLALRGFADATANSSYGQLFAMATVSLLPIFLVFVASQRLLVEGISTSGLKG